MMHFCLHQDDAIPSGALAVQGEMSATVMYFPQQYSNLLPGLRARITTGRPSSFTSNVRVGVSLNFDKLCACVLQVLLLCYC